MIGLKRIAACAAIALFGVAHSALADAPRPIEDTLAWQLLKTESEVRSVSPAKFALLRSALEKATYAAVGAHWTNRNRREAIETLDAVHAALAQHNFIQPTRARDLRDTMGDALEPLRLSPEERRALLAPGEVNGFRARYVDPTKPLYYMDDDMGAQLFLSVGQRLGWTINLVSAYDRYFVRWYFKPGEAVNYDWTAGGPTRDDAYRTSGPGELYQYWPERKRYLKPLSFGYARSNYLYLMSLHVNGQGRRIALERAMRSDPTHELVQNSLAWLYATDPSLARSKAPQAISYGLSAWGAMPGEPSIADTVACAYAGAGERALAAQIERTAIEMLRRDRRTDLIPDYQARLRQIEAGGLCGVSQSSGDPD